MIQLRPYQVTIAKAVMDSVMNSKGLTFSVEIARQGGKNELSAQLEVLILTLNMLEGGNSIKCSPTFKPQTVISMQRLKERLNDWGYDGFWTSEQGYIIRLHKASQVFLSADESANVVGNTAHHLLEIDESQDVGKDKYSKEFRPMGATTNVTTVHYGTTWDDSTLLEEVKQTNLELEKRDGVQRHFSYDWHEVARYNPNYAQYVEDERQRLGENHPLFLTQYCLQPISGGGRFLSSHQLTLLQGNHDPLTSPRPGAVYLAGIDLAGESEEIVDDMLVSASPKRDSTVLTIGELIIDPTAPLFVEPALKVVALYSWTGIKHTDIYAQLVSLLSDRWGCASIVVDATGIGQPICSFLRKALGRRIIPFVFNQRSKSDLAFDLLSFINGCRVQLYFPDDSPDYSNLIFQLLRAKSVFRPSQTMNFFVDPAEGHDDYLMSLALLVHAANQYRPRRVAKGVNPDVQ